MYVEVCYGEGVAAVRVAGVKETKMGGCSVLLLLPFFMIVGAVWMLMYAGLWVYVGFALVMLVFWGIVYAVAVRKGWFSRYENDTTSRRTASRAALWGLRFTLLFFLVTGIGAAIIRVVLF